MLNAGFMLNAAACGPCKKYKRAKEEWMKRRAKKKEDGLVDEFTPTAIRRCVYPTVVLSDLQQRSLMHTRGSVPTPSQC